MTLRNAKALSYAARLELGFILWNVYSSCLSVSELSPTCLYVDTALKFICLSAPFFESCINEQDLDEMNIEIIRNTLYKSYLEAFYAFCQKIGGETEEVMCEILAVSALSSHSVIHVRDPDPFCF